MKSTKIKDADISSMKIASLPSRPTAPTSFGGRGYTATEMKEAFDKLPLYLVEKFNNLIDDIYATGNESLAGSILTGISDGHTLTQLFDDISSGAIAAYLTVLGSPLAECVAEMREAIEEARTTGENANGAAADLTQKVTECRTEVDALSSAVTEVNGRLDTAFDMLASSGIDPENFILDCGAPADLIVPEGGEG